LTVISKDNNLLEMNFKVSIPLISIFLICCAYTGFSQTRHTNSYKLALPPSEAEVFKIYKIKENDLKRIRMPKNYILVKRPSEPMIFLLEIPTRVEPLEPVEKKEEKKDTAKTTNPSPGVEKLNPFELSKELNIGEIKTGLKQQIVQELLNVTH